VTVVSVCNFVNHSLMSM